ESVSGLECLPPEISMSPVGAERHGCGNKFRHCASATCALSILFGMAGPLRQLSSRISRQGTGSEGANLNAVRSDLTQSIRQGVRSRRSLARAKAVQPISARARWRSVRRAQQVTKEASYANLNEMPALDIVRYLGKRVVRRIKRPFGH